MKPEENPDNTTTPITPDSAQPEATPVDASSQVPEQSDSASLEQAAADLASAAADGATSMLNSVPASTPEQPTLGSSSDSVPEPTPTTLDNPEPNTPAPFSESSEPTSPAVEPASEPSFGAVENPDLSDVTPPTALDNSADDATNDLSNDELDSSTTSDSSTETDDSLDAPSDITQPLDTESPEVTSASFIGEAPKTEDKKEESEDDEPLVPADPVPGSIGSAIAYSEDAPNHSAPVAKKSKFKLFKKRSEDDDGSVEIGGKKLDSKKILIIVGIIVLVAIIAFVLFFVLGGSSQKKTTTKSSITTTPQSKESSLVCKKEGGGTAFSKYPQVVSGSEEIIVMYKDGILVSFGDNLKLNYETAEIASVRLNEIRSDYATTYNNLKFTTDPFESTFNVTGTTATVSHQADGSDIDVSNAKILGIPVLKGEVYSDVDSLQDNYESQGFTCTAK